MQKKNIIKIIVGVIAVMFAVVGGLLVKEKFFSKEDKVEIITESTLYKIANVSELSTYQCVYNGICTVKKDDNEDEVSYYCSYDAKVNAGIEFDKVKIAVDNEKKTINVTVPPVKITDVNVDIGTLDYMFVDEDANSSTISEKAYKASIADVKKKSAEENTINELAQQNAKNTIEALIKPFIEQLDNKYVLSVYSSDKEAAK